jgi:hypothetical protein
LLNVGNRDISVTFPEADAPAPASLAQDQALETPTLEQPEEFEDDHDNDNHSNYIKDVSAHAANLYQIAHAMVNIYPHLPASRGVSFAAKIRLTNRRS